MVTCLRKQKVASVAGAEWGGEWWEMRLERESWSQIYKGATWRHSQSQHPHVHEQVEEAERRNGDFAGDGLLRPFLFELEVSVDFFF